MERYCFHRCLSVNRRGVTPASGPRSLSGGTLVRTGVAPSPLARTMYPLPRTDGRYASCCFPQEDFLLPLIYLFPVVVIVTHYVCVFAVIPAHYGSRPQHLHYRVTSQDGTVDVSQMYFDFDAQSGKRPRYLTRI